MERARDILGVRQDWLGFVDSGWPEGDPKPPLPEGCFALVPVEEAAAPLVRLIREFRPHVVTTYDERGGYPHPDHIMCHRVSVAAFEAAGDPDALPGGGRAVAAAEALLPPHVQPAALPGAARGDARARAGVAVRRAARRVEAVDPEWDARITTRVPCADYFGVRDQALMAHATQIDPDGPWFAVPRELQESVWPHEDYRAGRPATSQPRVPEDDLFAGITDPA